MTSPIADPVARTDTDTLANSGLAAEKIMKGNSDALSESGHASSAALKELGKAYQDLATRNGRNLTAAIQALAAVRKPAEFIELQRKLIKEGVDAAVQDSQNIAQLTAAVFTAAFAPVKTRIDALQKTALS